MSHRSLCSHIAAPLVRTLAAAILIAALTGCHKKPETVAAAPPRPAPPHINDIDLKSYKPNEAGAIMIVMYHRFDPKEPNRDLNRQPDQFRKDLEDLYKRGYRPVTVSEIVDNKMDVPAGKTPIALTFDDSLPTQFKIITGQDGQPHIDPDCAVGIMETFHKEHPDWATKGTFFVLPHDGKPPAPFYQPGSVDEKFTYLLKSGYEIGNHTTTHPKLRNLSADKVLWEIATPVKNMKQIAPDAKLDVLALPYGSLPRKDAMQYLISGSYQGIQYHNKAVVLAAWRPIMSPVTRADKKFTNAGAFAVYNPYRLERVLPDPRQANKPGTFEYWLKYFDENPSERYVSDGNPNVVAVPKSMQRMVDADRVRKEGKVLQSLIRSRRRAADKDLRLMSKDRLTNLTFRVYEQMDLTPCNGCDCCGLRCEAGVPMSRSEYEAVQDFIASAPNREEILRVTMQDKTVNLGDDVTVQMCRYRDMEQGRCVVYPARPLICRLMGHIEWLPCPIEKVERIVPTEEAIALMQEYALHERRTFEGWDSEM